MAYHGLEKGASLAQPRRPFGLARRAEIEELIDFARRTGVQPASEEYALDALKAVDTFNQSGEISDEITPQSTWDRRAIDPRKVEDFIRSRHSVRNFDPARRIDPEVIRSIVQLAGATPSVCNRRAYRAHYFDDRAQIDSLLALQNGNAGFGHTIPGLFVITERRSAFVGAGERNQRWIDGGLFAMTIVWIAHAFGLGTCMLNWSQRNSQSDRLRKAAGIEVSEDVIVLIAVGHPAAGHRVARSPHRACDQIFVYHDSPQLT